MINTKSSLINKLGTIFLAGATGLVGLAGCETPQGNRNVSPYSQSQPEPYQQQTKEDDGNLEMSILGGVLGVGLVGKGLRANMNPVARAATEATTRGIGNGMLAHSTRPKTDVQVNINGAQQNAQPQVVYAPEPRVLDERLLPEYNLEQLQKEWSATSTGSNVFEEGIYSVFTSRNAQDLNGDGIFSFNEFIKVKRNFKRGEPIKLNAGFIARNGGLITNKVPGAYKISFEILNEQGESVFRYESPQTQEKLWNSKAFSLRLPKLKPGVYNAKCAYSSKKITNQKGAVFQVLDEK